MLLFQKMLQGWTHLNPLVENFSDLNTTDFPPTWWFRKGKTPFFSGKVRLVKSEIFATQELELMSADELLVLCHKKGLPIDT